MERSDHKNLPITYSCHFAAFREGEQYVFNHSLGMVLSGEMELNDGTNKVLLKKGDVYAARKNQLAKFVKYPTETGEFKSISILFDDTLLRDFSLEYGYTAEPKSKVSAFAKFPENESLSAFIASLLSYEKVLKEENNIALMRIKQKEALLLLLEYDESLQDILFDFSDPYKIDLAEFMQKNFHFNVNIERFAYLTGRSLATFKRDFNNIFHTSPRNWLQEKRLQEAYFLIHKKKKKPVEIYLDLGFEDLSHFSFAFKKRYGKSPSELK